MSKRKPPLWSWAAGVVAVVVLAVNGPALAGVFTIPTPDLSHITTAEPNTAPPAQPDSVATETRTAAASALAELDAVPAVDGPPPVAYDRALFGQRWADEDRNGCDTRNDTLRRDLVDVAFKPGTHDCVVIAGVLHDSYTGETVPFEFKSDGYQPVQVDHLIPLALAWETGADRWTDEKRRAFANDPENLQITTANQAKGDSGPGAWLPPNPGYLCTYAIRFTHLTVKYELAVTTPDRTVTRELLERCSSGD